jgi:hypothetical protein
MLLCIAEPESSSLLLEEMFMAKIDVESLLREAGLTVEDVKAMKASKIEKGKPSRFFSASKYMTKGSEKRPSHVTSDIVLCDQNGAPFRVLAFGQMRDVAILPHTAECLLKVLDGDVAAVKAALTKAIKTAREARPEKGTVNAQVEDKRVYL